MVYWIWGPRVIVSLGSGELRAIDQCQRGWIGLSDCTWRNVFPNAYVENMCCLHSDHCPLLIRCKAPVADRNDRPFRIQAAWTLHQDFHALVQAAWSNGNHVVLNSLDTVRDDALEFNRNIVGNIFRRKRTIEARLRGIQKTLEHSDVRGLVLLKADLRKEYNDVLR